MIRRPSLRRARQLVERWGPWFGVFVPAVDYVVSFAVGLAQPHYDPLTEYVSLLTVPSVHWSWLLRGWLMAFPLLFLPFVLSVRLRLGRARWAWFAPAAMLLFSLTMAAMGTFHCDPGCRGQTMSGQAHLTASLVSAVAAAFAPPGLEMAIRRHPRWREVRWVNRAWLPLEAGAGTLLALANLHVLAWHGLFERLYYGIFYLWLIFLAIHLVGMNKADGSTRQPRGRASP